MTKKMFMTILIGLVAVGFFAVETSGVQVKKVDTTNLYRNFPGAGPDLLVRIKIVTQKAIYPGIPLNKFLEVSVKNQGGSEARDFKVVVAMGKNLQLQPLVNPFLSASRREVQVLFQDQIQLLAAGATRALTFGLQNKIPDDAPCGKVNLGAFVDVENKVKENSETNNSDIAPLLLQVVIQKVRQLSAGNVLTETDLQGFGFGNAENGKKVYFNSTPLTDVFLWTPAALSATIPYGVNHGQNYIVTVKKGSTTISNEVQFFLLRWLEGANPAQGSAGQTINLDGMHMGTPQGSKILKLGTTTVSSIVSWDGSIIVFKVPATVAPGKYELFIMDGGIVVSNKINFTVL